MGASEPGAHVESLVERLGRALLGPAVVNRAIVLRRLGPSGCHPSHRRAPAAISHLVIFRRRLKTANAAAAAAPTSLTQLSSIVSAMEGGKLLARHQPATS